MKENWITWALLGFIAWELYQEKQCACDSSAPSLPCTADAANTPQGESPIWIEALRYID